MYWTGNDTLEWGRGLIIIRREDNKYGWMCTKTNTLKRMDDTPQKRINIQ